MSYVLNALNKSEQARTTPVGAPAAAPAPAPSAQDNKRATLLRWVVALLLALLGGVLIDQYRMDWPWYNREEPASRPASSSALPLEERELPVVKLSQAATDSSTATRRLIGRVTALTTACQMTVQSHAGESLLIQLAGISCLPPHTPTGKAAWELTSLFVRGDVVLFLSPDRPTKPLQATLFDQESVLLNRLLVRQGLVTITDDRFRPDEEEARSARRGIWQDSALRTTQHSAIAKPLSP